MCCALLMQSHCYKLQSWAARSLQQGLPDQSLAELHRQLLKQAANSGSSSASQQASTTAVAGLSC